MFNVPVEQVDWSFVNLQQAETLWVPHGYHRYPAKFIPQLVQQIIKYFAAPNDFIGDVFLGSDTTGVEVLRTGHKFYGSDINPVACMISQAKCTPLNPSLLEESWRELKGKLVNTPRTGKRKLTNEEKAAISRVKIARATKDERLSYWFPHSHQKGIAFILETIGALNVSSMRLFMLCALSNTLHKALFGLAT